MSTSSRPNVHLFVIFGRDAEDSPLAVALRGLGLKLTIHSDFVRLNYHARILRFVLGWPALLWYSLKSCYRTLQADEAADAVIVYSHFDILAFAVLCRLLFRPMPPIIFPTFIYTEHSGPLLQGLKAFYYRRILRHADVVICHSEAEVVTNQKRFGGAKTRFVYSPYAIHINGASGFTDSTLSADTVVSAGRSGRDYALLVDAFRELDTPLHLICDMLPEELASGLPPNVRVLDSCYGDCYFNELAGCRFVVVPLGVDDISAGQMVLLQAMAMGKPVVITRTATTCNYVSEGDGIIFVEPGDRQALISAVRRLSTDDGLCETLGRQAANTYRERYSIEAWAGHLARAVDMTCRD